MFEALEDAIQIPWARTVQGCVVLALVAWLGNRLVGRLLFHAVHSVLVRTASRWGDVLVEHGMFRWLSRLAPSLVVQFGVDLVPDVPQSVLQLIGNIAQAMTTFLVAMAISSAMSAAEQMRLRHAGKNRRSVRGMVKLCKLVLFTGTALVIVGEIVEKTAGANMGVLLSGFGALSAVLMLVFKDTILGFVADIQLSANDMLRLGDKITMDSAGVDGEVIDISLHTVKIRNFDNTVITVPTWRLIGDSYQNWRGMADSGVRRIKRELAVDASCIRFLDEIQVASLTRFLLLRDYLEGKHVDIHRWNEALGVDASVPVNRRRQTNIGAFRAYALAYLKAHPGIHSSMPCMVRMRAPNTYGVPLEIYAFARTTELEDFEGIAGDIFDHLIAILPEFGMAMYQQPSGSDLQAAARGMALSKPA
jgi:miniconductance mechanosensitive channel